ncbi:Peripheral-type benzodiazepine receptor-associated protein 1 [Oryzias melastigma]|uniref:Peripheral-type benzodiazepine receptor-associated protein 1 n=1 Tax=Oryzias melastigma TaxID=30732 RepID=A0A834CHX4_ORYME|nr:Peripheral-type benzodiazepine receptor-associated protein 1 [Oryzias melastigma]
MRHNGVCFSMILPDSCRETEISNSTKECETLEVEVKKKNQTCQTLENDLQDFLQENKHVNLQWFNSSHKASEHEKVKLEYAQLKETLGAVTKERDLALLERNQLQSKLENLEQVLKLWNLFHSTLSYLCYTASTGFCSAVLSNALNMSVAFQCPFWEF